MLVPPNIPRSPAGPRHRAMFAVDIASFSRRAPDLQVHLRAAMYKIIQESCDAAGVPWDGSHREDRGDGILVIERGDVNVAILLDALTNQIRGQLRTYNKLASPIAQIRLRMAVHAGYVDLDIHGASGAAVIHLFRLLDAPALKSQFAHHHGDFALIVSDYLHQEVIQHGPGLIEPASFQSIAVELKETSCRGWVWLPPTDKF
jgi:hypothetical protein